MNPDALLFFDGHQNSLPLFQAFESKLYALFPEVERRVQKTQITYYSQHVFACVSLLRVKRKAEMPDPYIVVTLGLPHPLKSPRAAAQCEPYPNRWTIHILIGSIREIDDELFSWVQEAYDFSNRKQKRSETV